VANGLQKELDRAFPGQSSRSHSALLMLSGGLDSVALLANILQETSQTVHAHHIEIQNFEDRRQAENDALHRILAYCREHYRPFTFTTSVSEFPLGLGGGYDLTLALFTAARVHTALGRVVDIVYTGHIAPSRAEIVEGAAVFNACYINKRCKPVWLRPLAHVKKADIYQSIPLELAEMTWSCRKPVYRGSSYEACGSCHACRSRAQVSALLSAQHGH
jgi:7-cyano-7-deazaguanine synthase in queuosine biosynthesis